MALILAAAGDDGIARAVGSYSGGWTCDSSVEAFVADAPATLTAHERGGVRWLFAFWPSGTPFGVIRLGRHLAVEPGGEIVLPLGTWLVQFHPDPPTDAPAAVDVWKWLSGAAA